jgi:hypothetical protein
MKARKHSNLITLARFGIGPFVLGVYVTVMGGILVKRLPDDGDAWMVLALGVAMVCASVGSAVYGWWLDSQSAKSETVGSNS